MSTAGHGERIAGAAARGGGEPRASSTLIARARWRRLGPLGGGCEAGAEHLAAALEF